MPDFLEQCRLLFGTDDLYAVFHLAREDQPSEQQLKKAYRKLSLKVHPDRVQKNHKEEATQKFQILSKAYSILSDKDKRAVYDESGGVGDDEISQDRDWTDYWRILFAKVQEKDIESFESKYRGSSDERSDVKSAYLKCEGCMDGILSHVMCATVDDEPRFQIMIKEMIKQKDVPKFGKFVNESKSKRQARQHKAKQEADEVKAMLAKKKCNSLEMQIQIRQQDRKKDMQNFFSDMEARYAAMDEASTSAKQKRRKCSKSAEKTTEKTNASKANTRRGTKSANKAQATKPTRKNTNTNAKQTNKSQPSTSKAADEDEVGCDGSADEYSSSCEDFESDREDLGDEQSTSKGSCKQLSASKHGSETAHDKASCSNLSQSSKEETDGYTTGSDDGSLAISSKSEPSPVPAGMARTIARPGKSDITEIKKERNKIKIKDSHLIVTGEKNDDCYLTDETLSTTVSSTYALASQNASRASSKQSLMEQSASEAEYDDSTDSHVNHVQEEVAEINAVPSRKATREDFTTDPSHAADVQKKSKSCTTVRGKHLPNKQKEKINCEVLQKKRSNKCMEATEHGEEGSRLDHSTPAEKTSMNSSKEFTKTRPSCSSSRKRKRQPSEQGETSCLERTPSTKKLRSGRNETADSQ